MAWRRDEGSVAGDPVAPARTMADYAPAALPERQPAVATMLPTRLGHLAVWAAGILFVVAAVLAAGLHEPTIAGLGRATGPRFTRSVAALRDCVDPRLASSLAGWMAQMLLVAAAAVALVVRSMRRHRRDDYSGRYRAWGWLAWLLVAASCSAQVPIGRAVAAFVAEASGVSFGPSGYGWWVAITTSLLVGVALWAVVPLHERLATAFWLSLGLGAWGVSAAAIWLGADPRVHAAVAPAAWAAGSGLITIAMLVAARSVIREVRGEAGNAGRRMKARPPTAKERLIQAVEDTATEEPEAEPGAWEPAGSPASDYTDGSDGDEDRETRHLSKAERKRLKKLARMNRVA